MSKIAVQLFFGLVSWSIMVHYDSLKFQIGKYSFHPSTPHPLDPLDFYIQMFQDSQTPQTPSFSRSSDPLHHHISCTLDSPQPLAELCVQVWLLFHGQDYLILLNFIR